MRHPVPHKIQSNTYNCGPICLEMLLDFHNLDYEAEVVEELCGALPGIGTENGKLANAVEHFGTKPVVKENASLDDIINSIKNGHPVLVNYFNCRSGVGHFGVVKGIDMKEQELLLADPKNGDDYRLTFGHFQQHWHDHTKTIHAWMMYIERV